MEANLILETVRHRVLVFERIQAGENYSFDTEAGRLNFRLEPHKDIILCWCGEPMIFTFEFKLNEYFCQVCGQMCGMLAYADRVPSTPKLRKRLTQLRAEYEAARAERQS